MHYMKLDAIGRQDLLAELEAMPAFLEETFAGLSAERMRLQGPEGLFSPVEQVWHLADLEHEGFGARIDRLRWELNPGLPDFDGVAVAAARNYLTLSLANGLRVFKPPGSTICKSFARSRTTPGNGVEHWRELEGSRCAISHQ